jgi:hypothetical protein
VLGAVRGPATARTRESATRAGVHRPPEGEGDEMNWFDSQKDAKLQESAKRKSCQCEASTLPGDCHPRLERRDS